jgi:hypothetical protein
LAAGFLSQIRLEMTSQERLDQFEIQFSAQILLTSVRLIW